MKLDKYKFARLVAYVMSLKPELYVEVEHLDDLCDIDMPEPPKCNSNNIEALLKAMAEDKLIEAIKIYRTMTGSSLKESKDLVEKYFIARTLRRIGDALGTAEKGDALIAVARNAHAAEMELADIKRNQPAKLSNILGKNDD